MGKQDQIDQLGRRVGELEVAVNGDDTGEPGLVDRDAATHEIVMALKDEVACLRRRVWALEEVARNTAEATQAEPKAKPVTQERVFAALDADEDRRELAEWKARAEKAEAEVADLQAQIRGVKRVLGVPMPAENSFHKGKAA